MYMPWQCYHVPGHQSLHINNTLLLIYSCGKFSNTCNKHETIINPFISCYIKKRKEKSVGAFPKSNRNRATDEHIADNTSIHVHAPDCLYTQKVAKLI